MSSDDAVVIRDTENKKFAVEMFFGVSTANQVEVRTPMAPSDVQVFRLFDTHTEAARYAATFNDELSDSGYPTEFGILDYTRILDYTHVKENDERL